MTEPDPARARFFALGLIRLSGVVVAFTGVSIVVKRWLEPADLIGGALMAVGAFAVMILPLMLVKRWRTPKE